MIYKKNNQAVLKLLIHLLSLAKNEGGICHDLESITEILVIKLQSDQNYHNDLFKLCDLLAKHQCPNAGKIKSSIGNKQ